jgi:hypothetical protein
MPQFAVPYRHGAEDTEESNDKPSLIIPLVTKQNSDQPMISAGPEFVPVTQYVYCEVGNEVLNNFPFLNTVDRLLRELLGGMDGGCAIMQIVWHFRIMYIYIFIYIYIYQ